MQQNITYKLYKSTRNANCKLLPLKCSTNLAHRACPCVMGWGVGGRGWRGINGGYGAHGGLAGS